MSYGFHPAAEAEHLESVAFFESKRPGWVLRISQSLKESCAKPVKRHTDTRLKNNRMSGASE